MHLPVPSTCSRWRQKGVSERQSSSLLVLLWPVRKTPYALLNERRWCWDRRETWRLPLAGLHAVTFSTGGLVSTSISNPPGSRPRTTLIERLEPAPQGPRWRALEMPALLSPLGEGDGYPLRNSCLENPMDRGALASYSPWGHQESDTTEQLTLALSVTSEDLSVTFPN